MCISIDYRLVFLAEFTTIAKNFATATSIILNVSALIPNSSLASGNYYFNQYDIRV